MEDSSQPSKASQTPIQQPQNTPAPFSSGINAVHVNTARQMVQMHTSGRRPNRGNGGNPTTILPPPAPSALPRPVNQLAMSLTAPVSVPAILDHSECRNPQCAHCGQVIIPSPKSSFPIVDQPSISVGDWSIYRIKKPILNSAELDALELRFEFPMPEMIFGNSSIRLQNDKTGACIEFNGLDALETLDEVSDLRVSYHKEWLDSRRLSPAAPQKAPESRERPAKDLGELTSLESVKPYDWTYSTAYKGTVRLAKFVPAAGELPLAKLLRPDPILFFDELVLFEDELGDNGISMLSTKIRVMHTCVLLLCRLFLRIDNVIFRIRDTRVYIDLDTNEVWREYKVQEGSYDEVLQKVRAKVVADPKSLMRDVNWIASNIPVLSCEVETMDMGGPGDRK